MKSNPGSKVVAKKKVSGGFLETVKTIVYAVLIALVVRTFAYEPFNIPSGSMIPTLLVGDYLFVSKYSYGYSHYSLPFSPPLFSGRIFGSEPQRGDVVVFRLPRDPSTDYVSRVVGLPGDSIQMIGGQLHINGQGIKRERVEDFVETEGTRASRIKQWRETLPNEVSHTTLDLVDNGFRTCGHFIENPPDVFPDDPQSDDDYAQQEGGQRGQCREACHLPVAEDRGGHESRCLAKD